MNDYLVEFIKGKQYDKKISRWMTYGEVIASQTAARLGIGNIPTVEQLAAAQQLCIYVVDPIREFYGNPFICSSFYRSVKLNKHIPGSSSTSQHSEGEAVDFDYERYGISNKQLLHDIVFEIDVPFDQVIYEYGRWIHISHEPCGEQRGSILLASTNMWGNQSYKQITKEQIKEL